MIFLMGGKTVYFKTVIVFAVFALLTFLFGCAKRVVTRHSPPLYYEEGYASWYGPGFHGKKTASGEIFNQRELTAAHKTLPFNTRVRVLNTENNTSVVVRINDRGPFIRGRVIDLSKEAARIAGFLDKGAAKVKLFVISEEEVFDSVTAKIFDSIRSSIDRLKGSISFLTKLI